jgi:hypothetical protein
MKIPNIKRAQSVRIDGVYQESPIRATAQVIADFPIVKGSTVQDDGCETHPDAAREECSFPIKMVRYDSGWDLDKEELARQEAAQRQADRDFIRELNARSEIEAEKTAALKRENEEMERQIKREERDLGMGGKPPKPLTAQQKRNCDGWGDPNPGVPDQVGESKQYCP